MNEQRNMELSNILKNLWNQRSQIVPKYKSPTLKIITKEEMEKNEKIENEKIICNCSRKDTAKRRGSTITLNEERQIWQSGKKRRSVGDINR